MYMYMYVHGLLWAPIISLRHMVCLIVVTCTVYSQYRLYHCTVFEYILVVFVEELRLPSVNRRMTTISSSKRRLGPI